MSAFYCERLKCSGITPEQCIRRQVIKTKVGGDGDGKTYYVPAYSQCQDCAQGKAVMEARPELVEAMRKKKRRAKKDCRPRVKSNNAGGFPTYYHREPRKGEEEMGRRVATSKVCSKCKKEFKPTCNKQIYCPGCKRKPGKLFKKNPEGWRPEKRTTETPVKGAGHYVVTVDFSRYPKLHERLLDLATEEYRSPDQQILKMLNEEMAEREKALAG